MARSPVSLNAEDIMTFRKRNIAARLCARSVVRLAGRPWGQQRPNEHRRMKRYRALALSTVLGSIVALPAAAATLPTCAQLGTDPAYGLAGNPQITNLTTTLYAPGADANCNPFFGCSFNAKAECRVDFTFSSECCPSACYLAREC